MESHPQRELRTGGSGEAHERTVAPSIPRCPKCGWRNVRFSHNKGVVDSALGMFSIFPFRCRSCGSRFHRFYRKPEEE